MATYNGWGTTTPKEVRTLNGLKAPTTPNPTVGQLWPRGSKTSAG